MVETRDDILAEIDAAWTKHAQPAVLNIPAGAESYVRHESMLMSQRGFRLAAIDLINTLTQTDHNHG